MTPSPSTGIQEVILYKQSITATIVMGSGIQPDLPYSLTKSNTLPFLLFLT